MIRLLLVITKTEVRKTEEPPGDDQSAEEENKHKEKKPSDKLKYHSDLESVATLRDNYWPLTNKFDYFTKKIVKYVNYTIIN